VLNTDFQYQPVLRGIIDVLSSCYHTACNTALVAEKKTLTMVYCTVVFDK